jgi:NTP pyrophosphatase (non-canonical NTP hydrolase)
MPKTLKIDDILQKIKQFSKDRDWDQFHSIKNLVMALSVESSELVEIYQWLSEEESNNKTEQTIKKRAEEELADIFIYLLRIVDKLDINLQKAVEDKLEQNAEKYPVSKAFGNSKKYTEF